MLKKTALALASILLLTGCSVNTKPEYDPVELAEYEACLSQVSTKSPSGFDSKFGNEIEGILKWCESLKPVKR